MMRVLDLFSGIGGFSLGLERTGGFKTVAFCEIDPYCRKVLAKHWPGVPIYGDVEALEQFPAADVITAGFPCQDISFAGLGAGLAGPRSGLYRHVVRAIRMVRPFRAVLENVAALLGRGLDTVLGDLAAIGYDAEWHCIPASAIGAPHRRDRIWIVCHPDNEGQSIGAEHDEASRVPRLGDTYGSRLSLSGQEPVGTDGHDTGGTAAANGWWSTEPDVGRVAHGVPSRVDRLRALGNAVVPQIPELIGRAILNVDKIPMAD